MHSCCLRSLQCWFTAACPPCRPSAAPPLLATLFRRRLTTISGGTWWSPGRRLHWACRASTGAALRTRTVAMHAHAHRRQLQHAAPCVLHISTSCAHQQQRRRARHATRCSCRHNVHCCCNLLLMCRACRPPTRTRRKMCSNKSSRDGVALLFDSDRFEMLSHCSLRFSDHVPAGDAVSDAGEGEAGRGRACMRPCTHACVPAPHSCAAASMPACIRACAHACVLSGS